MARIEHFYYDSHAPGRKIHAVRYLPEGEPRAVLQIAHGMVEFIERYEDFACWLTERGFLVTGNDHLGHGSSIRTKEDYGYFADGDANGTVLADVHRLTELTKEAYPGLPYFLLGHSMGSFYARQYLCQHGRELDGAIIMGTGCQPRWLVRAGKLLTCLVAAIKGWHYRSKLVTNVAFGGYNKRFEPVRTPKDWLTKDEAIVDAYIADERSSFIFTLNAYHAMFTGIHRLYDKKLLGQMPKELPVFFVAGEEDPVGDFGKGVLRAAQMCRDIGMTKISVKLYPGDRHEILNETDRQTVYQDLAEWLEKNL
ncbi:MAG: alpha/beta fold hydrolase [Ruminiclostridium sp.]|nr:alpha/beta fold hydrolase [Ruminiclostridium sp.]